MCEKMGMRAFVDNWAVRFLGVSAHRLGGHLWRHHPILEPGKYTLLKVTQCDRAGVRAGAIDNTGGTGITVLVAQRTGEDATIVQHGEQRLRPVQAVQPIRLRLPYNLGDIDILVGDFARLKNSSPRAPVADRLQLRLTGLIKMIIIK